MHAEHPLENIFIEQIPVNASQGFQLDHMLEIFS
jgi:hypothetical protein